MDGGEASVPRLHLVAWEITRGCNLYCAHCRASASYGPYPGELSTEQCFRLVDQILEVGRPVLILTGGEPLARQDVFDIGKYAAGRGLRVVMGTNGTLVTEVVARRLKEIPLSRLGVSLDFPTPDLQDRFRGQKGAFAAALAGIRNAQEAGIGIQINSTISKLNARHLDALLNLALEIGAEAFHPFMLVPTGRGKDLEHQELTPQEYEDVLNWIYDKQQELGDRIFFKPTDAPHYWRVVRQRQAADKVTAASPIGRQGHGHGGMDRLTRGCLAGVGFCFISHVGKVQGCGYFTAEAGDVKRQTFAEVWNDSPLFRSLRDLGNLKGKCGACEFKAICGGCRARAYEATGDYLAQEPYCVYEPLAVRRASGASK
jgi:heme b synthase